MANRNFNQFRLALEKSVVDIFATVTFGASGAPTLEAWTGSPFGKNANVAATAGYKGVASVTQNGTGDYTFTFQDSYQRVLAVKVDGCNSTGAVSTNGVGLKAASLAALVTAIQGKTLNVITLANGVAADPASGDTLFFTFTLSNSSAQ